MGDVSQDNVGMLVLVQHLLLVRHPLLGWLILQCKSAVLLHPMTQWPLQVRYCFTALLTELLSWVDLQTLFLRMHPQILCKTLS